MERIKGLILTLVERYIAEHHPESVLDGVLMHCGQTGRDPWLAPLDYDRSELDRLLVGLAVATGRSTELLARDVARWVVPQLLQRYASIVVAARDPRSLLDLLAEPSQRDFLRLLGLLGAAHFPCEWLADGSLVVSRPASASPCSALEGLLEGLADHYGMSCRCTHQHCVRRGDAQCRLLARFQTLKVHP